MLSTYLELGFDHILDVKGYDHILFVMVLCVAYRPSEWKKMLVLVTAFTVGHSVTLGLAGLGLVKIDSQLVETLIPVTIIVSALVNMYEAIKRQSLGAVHYAIALLFGLVHGLGFSNFFNSLVSPDESIVPMLFSFNVGVELGQIAIVVLMFALAWVLIQKLSLVTHQQYNIVVSLLCALAAGGILLGIL